jgi:hypothetical protein
MSFALHALHPHPATEAKIANPFGRDPWVLVEVGPLAALLSKEAIPFGCEFENALAGLGRTEGTLRQRFARLLILAFAILRIARLAMALALLTLSLTLTITVAVTMTIASPAAALVPLVAEALAPMMLLLMARLPVALPSLSSLSSLSLALAFT